MALLSKKKEEKLNIEDAYKLYKDEAGEEIEQIELKKSFIQKQKEKMEEQADIKRKIRQEQQYSNTDKKLEQMRLECESIRQRQADNPNYMPSKAERKKMLDYANAERKAKLKKQDDEKKELARKAQRMKRRRNATSTVPRSVQDTIPYIADYEEGLFEIAEGLFSKTIEMQDINYLVSKEEEQIAMFCKYGEFLNYFSEDMKLNITIINRKVNQETQAGDVTFRMREDGLDAHRKEYNKIMLRQLVNGKNDIVQNKYATITLKANNPFEALLKFHKVENDSIENLKRIGSVSRVVSTDERLSLLHDILRAGHEGEFRINYDFIKKQGISSKDYIAPASFFFDRDYFMIDDKYYRVMFLNNLPASISDDFMHKITDVDFPTITNMMIQPVEQAKGLRLINKQITGMEAEKIEKSKKAVTSGYDVESVSHSLNQSIYEGKELQDDMMNKNQKMFLTSITVMVWADSLEELKNNCDTIDSKARQFTCRMQTLNYQQEEGFIQSLVLGHDALFINRTLTTESSAIFIPFTSNELFEAGGFYYGINQLSKNLVLFDRNKLKVPHGFVLGSSGSGKSFATKREMLNVILNMSEDESDMIVIDPDNEYLGFISAFGELAEVINISANSSNHINPLDLSLNYSDGDADPLTLKSDFIMSIVESMMSVGSSRETIITPSQKTLVDRALRNTYRKLIEHNYDEAWMPTLLDFQAELDAEKRNAQGFSDDARIVAESVEYYTKGSMSVFAHKTNVDLKKRLIVFNTRDLGGQLKQIGLMIVLDFVWNKMVQNSDDKKLTYLYIDEVHTLFTNEFSASFLKQLYKRGRKYGLVITAITQDVEDLLKNEDARGMISNSNYILMLNQSNENLEILTEMLHLSETQQGYVTMSEQGFGLLFAGNVIVPFKDRFPKDSYLYKLMSTKFGENLDDDEVEISKEDEAILRKHFTFKQTNASPKESSHREEVGAKESEIINTPVASDEKTAIAETTEVVEAEVETEVEVEVSTDLSANEPQEVRGKDALEVINALIKEMDEKSQPQGESLEVDTETEEVVETTEAVEEAETVEETEVDIPASDEDGKTVTLDTQLDDFFNNVDNASEEDKRKMMEQLMMRLMSK